jgi:Holliday junction resolvasome RuvABC endonuclease subunit
VKTKVQDMMGITGVVGIDLSLVSTGVARLWAKNAVCNKESYGIVETSPKMKMMDRWEKILAGIRSRIDVHDVIFIEDYAYGMPGHSSALVTLAEIGGLVRYVMGRLVRRPLIPVNLSVIKLWATGDGKAKKDDIKLGCYKRYGIEFKTSDEADAYALADFGWHVCNVLEPRRKLFVWEKEAIGRFRKSFTSL